MENLRYWVSLAAVAISALTGVLEAGRKKMDLVAVRGLRLPPCLLLIPMRPAWG